MLATPIIVGQLSQMLMSVTDSVMIGRVSKEALAASAFAGSIWGVFFIVGVGLMIPVTIMASQARGANDSVEVSRWVQHGLLLGTVAGTLGAVLMILVGTQLHRFGQPPEVLVLVNPYYQLIAISLVPTLWFQVKKQYAESHDHAVAPMVMMVLGILLNVFLNWVFIYGNLGVPALGLTGAGVATLISRSIGVLVLWWWIVNLAPGLRAGWPAHWFSGYEWKRFGRLLKVGVPIAFSLVFEAAAFGAAAIMMGWLGATALASHQIAISCAAFTFMIPLGMSMAVSMRVGRAVGEGRQDALRPIGLGAQAMSAIVMGLFAVLFAFEGQWLASGFVSEREVIALAGKLLVVAAVFQLADGAQVVAASALRGLTDVKVPTAITAVAYWGLALPIAYGLGVKSGWGPTGIWTGLAVGLIFAAVALNARFLRMTRTGDTP